MAVNKTVISVFDFRNNRVIIFVVYIGSVITAVDSCSIYKSLKIFC